jgi:hypothetical protein
MIKSLRLIHAGILIGIGLSMGLFSEEIDQSPRKRIACKEINNQFNSIINNQENNNHA